MSEETLQLYSAKDVAGILRIGKSQLYELISNSGLQPTLYLGRSPRWTHAAIHAWIAEQQQKPSLP